MTICELCEQEKEKAYSCMKRIEGQIPFGDETHFNQVPHRCSDCRVGLGGFHHLGCGIEECPKCHSHLLFCVCEETQDYRSLTAHIWWTRIPRGMLESVM